MSNDRIELQKRTAAATEEPAFFDHLFDLIAEGKHLLTYCQENNLSYSFVWRAIKGDPKRFERYHDALNVQKEYRIQKIFQELEAISHMDLRQAYDKRGKLKPPSEWPDGFSRAIASVESDGEVSKIKLWDKLNALQLLGKNLAMFVERVEHSGSITLEDLVKESNK